MFREAANNDAFDELEKIRDVGDNVGSNWRHRDAMLVS